MTQLFKASTGYQEGAESWADTDTGGFFSLDDEMIKKEG